jgi:hypothetical protein
MAHCFLYDPLSLLRGIFFLTVSQNDECFAVSPYFAETGYFKKQQNKLNDPSFFANVFWQKSLSSLLVISTIRSEIKLDTVRCWKHAVITSHLNYF